MPILLFCPDSTPNPRTSQSLWWSFVALSPPRKKAIGKRSRASWRAEPTRTHPKTRRPLLWLASGVPAEKESLAGSLKSDNPGPQHGGESFQESAMLAVWRVSAETAQIGRAH